MGSVDGSQPGCCQAGKVKIADAHSWAGPCAPALTLLQFGSCMPRPLQGLCVGPHPVKQVGSDRKLCMCV